MKSTNHVTVAMEADGQAVLIRMRTAKGAVALALPKRSLRALLALAERSLRTADGETIEAEIRTKEM